MASFQDAFIALISMIESEKEQVPVNVFTEEYKQDHPDCPGNNIGSFIADLLADAIGIDWPKASTSQYSPVIWRRQNIEDQFPTKHKLGVIVLSEEALNLIERADKTDHFEGSSFLKDMFNELRSNCVTLFVFLGSTYLVEKERCPLLVRKIEDEPYSTTAINVPGQFLSGDHLNSRLQHEVVGPILDILNSCFREELRSLPTKYRSQAPGHDQDRDDDPTLLELQNLVESLRNGSASKVIWSYFPSVQTKNQARRLSLAEASSLTEAMKGFGGNSHLKTIQLRGNRLGDDFICDYLCPGLKYCPRLSKILLGFNEITRRGAVCLAGSIEEHTKHLALLFINDNNIGDDGFRALVASMAFLESMKSFNADANGITRIPACISRLKKLEWLKLCRNKITELPEEITTMDNLLYLQLKGNPLRVPPIAVLSDPYDGSESSGSTTKDYIKEYYSAHRPGSLTIRVLGDGGMGKTSFIENLQRFRETGKVDFPSGQHVSTKGISVQAATLSDGVDTRIMEFGGQPQYYPIHRSFLDALCTVYVVIYRADQRQAAQSAKFWLKYVAACSKDLERDTHYRSLVLLCSTFNDTGISESPKALSLMEDLLNDEVLTTRFNFSKENAFDIDYRYPQSAAKCFKRLEQLAFDTAQHLEFVPSSYFDILTSCVKRGQDKPMGLVKVEEVREATRTKELTFASALKVLTQMGDVLHVHGMSYVFTDAQVLFTAIAKLVGSDSVRRNNGVCTVNLIARVLEVDKSHAKVLLEALRCFDFCFDSPIPTEPFAAHRRRSAVLHGDPSLENSTVWIFPYTRSGSSSRHEELSRMEENFDLYGFDFRFGRRFRPSRSHFMPPVILSLIERKIRVLGHVGRCTGNTISARLGQACRVVLSYEASAGKGPALDVVACSTTKGDCQRVLDTVSVCISRVASISLPQMILEQFALCKYCLSLQPCCEFQLKTPPPGRNLSSVIPRDGNRLRCSNSTTEFGWKDVVPSIKPLANRQDRDEFDVMISHAGEDTALAIDLFKWLTYRGVQCFLDEAHLSRTSDAENVIQPAMSWCKFCVCIITPIYCVKRWPRLEYEHFLNRERHHARQYLFPILIDVTPFEFVERSQMDFTSSPVIEELESAQDLSSRGRFDVCQGSRAFSYRALQRICSKICKKLDEASIATEEAAVAPQRGLYYTFERPEGLVKKTKLGRRYDFFISHAGEEKKTMARPLCDFLEANNKKPFLDERSIPGAAKIRDTIYAAVPDSQVGIFILTENFFRKKWPRLELDMFLFRESTERRTFGDSLLLFGILPFKQWPSFLANESLFDLISQRRMYTVRDWKKTPMSTLPDEDDRAMVAEDEMDDFVRCAGAWIIQEVHNHMQL